MDSGTTSQIRKRISFFEFKNLLSQHETFLLHLYNDDYDGMGMWNSVASMSLIEKRKDISNFETDPMNLFLSYMNLPYFEIPMEEGVEIMVDFGYPSNRIMHTVINKFTYARAVLIIHQGKVYFNTQDRCYCFETIIENLLEINENFVTVPD